MAAETPVAVVGGGTGALGRAVVERLVGDGWSVVVPARHPERAALPAPVTVVRCDLTVPADIDSLTAAVAARGRWAALANCSGGYAGGPAAEVAEDLVAEQIELNLLGPWRLARAAAVAMEASGKGGSIVNVASAAAAEPRAGAAPYQVSKAALVRLTEVMALELRESAVRVNAVLPGTIDTEANRRSMPGADTARWVSPSSVAAAIAWLLSDDAAAVSGALVPAR